jgi:hypothetical protein
MSIIDHTNSSGGLNRLCIGSSANEQQCQEAADRLRQNGTWWAPTVVIHARHRDDKWLSASRSIYGRHAELARAFWTGSSLVQPGHWLRDSTGAGSGTGSTSRPDSTADSVGVMRLVQRVGMPLLAATDMGPSDVMRMLPGFSLHTELAMLVAEGLTPLNALQSATLNPAKMLRATDSLGTVAPGKLADLVLLDADPLADIMNTAAIRAVVANGRYFDRAALDKLLAEIDADHSVLVRAVSDTITRRR